jgi:membrane protease YdiL (CAAX protease family)
VRAFAWFLGLIILALLIGACIAYPLYLLVAGAGWPFHRVAGRIAMLVLALELAWLCRHLGIRGKQDFGYGLPWRRFVSQSLQWGVIGSISASLGAAFLIGAGLRTFSAGSAPAAATLAHWLLVGLGSGIAVALIEETAMRGAMHTAIERESGPWAAAMLTAPLFAILHFFAKVRIPAEELAWRSGFDLLQRSFAPLAHPSMVLDSFLAWLVVGLILSLTRVLTGNIAVAIGLHAGWVVVLRILQEGTSRTAAAEHSAWVGQFDGLLGYWLLPWGAALALALWLSRSRWVAAASDIKHRGSAPPPPG